MRRSFGPNKLYSKVFFEHLRKLFQRGYSIEFFLKVAERELGDEVS